MKLNNCRDSLRVTTNDLLDAVQRRDKAESYLAASNEDREVVKDGNDNANWSVCAMLRKCRNDLQAEVTALKDQLANAQKTADGNVTTMRSVLQHLHEASSEFGHLR